ncbi:Uncharacterised protein [Mycobacteroides abscessus subsp. abscessus]|nr:Uncharacterised protein [Mycobacteroides abscessus subsp. abscessus]
MVTSPERFPDSMNSGSSALSPYPLEPQRMLLRTTG